MQTAAAGTTTMPTTGSDATTGTWTETTASASSDSSASGTATATPVTDPTTIAQLCDFVEAL